jgi:hypothetical protein
MAYKANETLKAAMQGDATAAADLWRAIDSGHAADDDAIAWARNVAGQIVAKVLDAPLEANRRREAAYRAIGFEGRIDKQREQRDALKQLYLNCPGMPLLEFVRTARLFGSDFEDVSDSNAVKRLERLIKK